MFYNHERKRIKKRAVKAVKAAKRKSKARRSVYERPTLTRILAEGRIDRQVEEWHKGRRRKIPVWRENEAW